MALAIPLLSPKLNTTQLAIISSKSHPFPSLETSFLPPTTTFGLLPLLPKRTAAAITSSSSSFPPPITAASSKPKMVRCPALDRLAARNSRVRFARKLKTLLLSKPRHFLPLRVLARCRHYLGLPPGRPLLPMIQRYPALFRLFHAPSHSPLTAHPSAPAVTLTPAAAALAAREADLRARLDAALAAKLHRLLMLAPRRRLLLANLVHLAPDLALPPHFRSRLCHRHPNRFRLLDTSYGRALELVQWDPQLSSPLPPIRPPPSDLDRPIIDRPPKFRQLRLRRGLNLKRRHQEFLLRFQELPEVDPYAAAAAAAERGGWQGESPEVAEKRACAAVREVLGMTAEKRTLVDHLTHLRKDLGLPNRLRGMLVRHPELFYVSLKGVRDSVFLVEAYDHKGRLLVEDELASEREGLMELVREGKAMRRERRRGVGLSDEEEEATEEEEEEEEEDGFEDLFESAINEEDWEDFGEAGADEAWSGEVQEFWVKKVASVAGAGMGGGENLDAW